MGAIALSSTTLPKTVTISPDGRTAYVTTIGSGVAVVDTAAKTTTTRIGGGRGVLTDAVAVAPDGQRVYLVDSAAGTATGFDTATHFRTSSTELNQPSALTLTPDGEYACAVGSTGVSVIDLTE